MEKPKHPGYYWVLTDTCGDPAIDEWADPEIAWWNGQAWITMWDGDPGDVIVVSKRLDAPYNKKLWEKIKLPSGSYVLSPRGP